VKAVVEQQSKEFTIQWLKTQRQNAESKIKELDNQIVDQTEPLFHLNIRKQYFQEQAKTAQKLLARYGSVAEVPK